MKVLNCIWIKSGYETLEMMTVNGVSTCPCCKLIQVSAQWILTGCFLDYLVAKTELARFLGLASGRQWGCGQMGKSVLDSNYDVSV